MRKKIIAACLAVMLACLLWLVKDRWSLPAAQKTEHEGLEGGVIPGRTSDALENSSD